VYCNNIQELLGVLQLEYTSEQWRLFVDASEVTLKAVLLHKGNKYPSIILAHAVHTKET